MNLSLKAKFYALLSPFVLVVVLAGIIGVAVHLALEDAVKDAAAHAGAVMQAERCGRAVHRQMQACAEYVRKGDGQDKESFHQAHQEAVHALADWRMKLAALQGRETGAELLDEQTRVTAMERTYASVDNVLQGIMALVGQGRTEEAKAFLERGFERVLEQPVLQQIDQVTRRGESELQTRIETVHQTVRITNITIAVGGALLLATAIASHWFLSRKLVQPILSLKEASARIATGDLAARVPIRSADELGALAGAFNQMAEQRQRTEGELRQAQADLEDRVTARTAELQRTMAAVRESEELFRSLSDCSPLGILLTDARGRCTYGNPRSRAMMGLSLMECMGEGWMASIHPEDRESVVNGWIESPAKKRGYSGEFRIQDRAGEVRWIRCHSGPRLSEQDEATGYVVTLEDITERKQPEQALRRSEERHRSLVETARDAIFTLSTDGVFTSLNQAFETITGWSCAEWMGRAFPSIVHPDDVPAAMDLFRRVIGGERPPVFELRIATKSGSFVTMEFTVTPRFRDERIEGILGIGRDITERKRAAEAIRESETRYLSLFENMLEGFAYCRMLFEEGRPQDFIYIEVNSAFEKLTGLKNATGKKVSEVVPDLKDTNPELFEVYGRVARTGRPERIELYLPPLKAWLSIAVYSPEKGFFVAVFDNVTERKRAEEERARLSQAVEQATESIVITDREGTILYVNPSFERISGYSRAEAIGKNPRILSSGKHDAEFYRAMWATLARGEAWTGLFINKHKDGTLYEEEATISPVRDAAGRVINYVAVKRDVTRERQMEQQFLQAQKMEVVGQLAGGVAHDFNNMLAAILGYGEIVLNKLPEDQSLRRNMEEIQKAAQRAASLTRQLLAFSRKQTLQPRVLDLNAVVADVSKMLKRLIGEHIELMTRLDSAQGRVKADPGQVEQILVNLAVNARDAMPQGGTLTIETRDATLDADYVRSHAEVVPGNYVVLSVSDTGVGMSEEVKAHLFEPFFTTKEEGKGTGLGLATCYGIVKQSGGHISVYSEPGMGSTFRVYLPRTEEAAGTMIPRGQPKEVPTGTETVLYVEDEPSVRELCTFSLRELGYHVLEATHGEEALRLARDHGGKEIHLLITDVVMPHVGGKELADRLKTVRPAMRILFVSGYTQDAITQQGILEEGTALLEKPFTSAALARKVREVLDAPDGGCSRNSP